MSIACWFAGEKPSPFEITFNYPCAMSNYAWMTRKRLNHSHPVHPSNRNQFFPFSQANQKRIPKPSLIKRRRNSRKKVSFQCFSFADQQGLVLRLGRNNTSRVSTSSAATTSTDQKPATTTTGSTPLSSVSVPQTIVKQDPETIQNELISFMGRRFGYRPYFKLSEINIGKFPALLSVNLERLFQRSNWN